MLSQTVYNSALAFTSCLHRAWRSARGENLGLFRCFLSMCPDQGMHMAFWIPQNSRELFKTLISSSSCFSHLFLPELSDLFIACSDCYTLPLLAVANTFALHAFNKHCLGSCLSPGEALRQAKQNKTLSQTFEEPPDKLKHIITIPWE